jgi:hypothetical protein
MGHRTLQGAVTCDPDSMSLVEAAMTMTNSKVIYTKYSKMVICDHDPLSLASRKHL